MKCDLNENYLLLSKAKCLFLNHFQNAYMEQSFILIYSQHITHRVKYAFKLIFTTALGVHVKFTNKPGDCEEFKGPIINYSDTDLQGILHVLPAGLLHETGIRPQQPATGIWRDLPLLFLTGKEALIPFDLFSAAFFMASRYEEYLAFEGDIHGRFRAEESFAYKNGFLHLPVIHLWANELKKIIVEKFPGFEFSESRYRFIPTLDVDVAMAYRHHGFKRTAGAFFKSFVTADLKTFAERATVLAGIKKDPFDTYETFNNLHEKFHLIPACFFAVGDPGPFDKNLPYRNKGFRKLISQLACRNRIGIHPSYDSWKNQKKIGTEKTRLELITRRKITASRQHFLKISFPETYNALIDSGINKDFTMGFASLPGFRAGMCFPFHWYDLKAEKETALEIWPFQVMDGTLNQYMKLTPEEAIQTIKEMIEQVKQVNGIFISLWHNHSLSGKKEWAGWEKVYEELVQLASEQ